MSQSPPAAPNISLALAVAPVANGAPLLFSARASGLYRSRDRGRNWERLALNQTPSPVVTAVAVSPAVASDQTVLAGTVGGILRSGDLGATWRFAALPAAPTISALVCSPDFAVDGVVLAGTLEDGMVRSTDRGQTWQPANPGLLDRAVLGVALSPAFADDHVAVAATTTGPYLSLTGGRSWRDLPFPELNDPCTAVAISPRFATDGVLLAGTDGSGLFRSTDGGASWQPVADLPATAEIVSVAFAPESRPGLGLGAIAVTSEAIAHSTDEGTTWSTRPLGLAPGELVIAATTFDPAAPGADLLVGTTDGAIRRVRQR